MQPLFESFPRPPLKSGVGPLARYDNHQEIISRRLEQMYTSSDTRFEWPGEGSLFESDSNKRQGGKMWALFESPLGHYLCQALGQIGTSVNHYHMQLNMFITFVENNVLINQQEG